MNKKILIFTASFGAGHNSVAKAIKKQLQEVYPSYEISIHDFMDIATPTFNKSMVKYYEIQTKHFPLIYNTYYYTRKVIDSKYSIPNLFHLKKVENFLLDENPDLIISTFPHASGSINKIKENSLIDTPLITVLTDVVDSNEWIHKNTNMYFVPSESIKNKLIKKNIPNRNIKVTGVPVDNNFSNSNIDSVPEKKKLLIMGGGRGLFDVSDSFFYWLDKFIDKSNNKIEATIVTGTNKNLYNKLTTKKPLKNISVHGFVTDMPSILKKHDFIITKAGGATLFESINCGLPVIIKKPNIGQEIENGKFIKNTNVGLMYSSEKELKNIIEEIANDISTDNLTSIMNNINQFKKEINPQHISNYIQEVM